MNADRALLARVNQAIMASARALAVCGAGGEWRVNRAWRSLAEPRHPHASASARLAPWAGLLAKGAEQAGARGQPVVLCAPARSCLSCRAPVRWQLRFQPVRRDNRVLAVMCRLQLRAGWLGMPGRPSVLPWYLPVAAVGGAPGAVLGRHLAPFIRHAVHQDDQQAFLRDLQRAVAHASRFAIDCRLRLPHGGYHWHRIVGEPERAADGRLLGFVGGSQDRQAQDETSRLRRTFLRLASHELNTPLTSLTLNLQSALLRAETLAMAQSPVEQSPSPNMLSPLRRAVEQARRLGHTVDTLIDVQSLLTGKLPLRRSAVDLAQLLRETCALVQPALLAAGCRIDGQLDEPIEGQFDKARMQQVFFHLLNNIAKFAPGSHVTLVARAKGAHVEIQVHDDGPGIPKGARKNVFCLFGRASFDRSTSGLGVGLFLCRRIVQAHGGVLQLDDRTAQRGAHFCLRLPRWPHTSASAAPCALTAPAALRVQGHVAAPPPCASASLVPPPSAPSGSAVRPRHA